jgi:hypothetical protein
MRAEPFHELLSGADRRSIGKSNQAVARVLRRPRGFRALIRCLWSENPVVRMRAADAAEKVSVRRPDLLIPFKSELLGLADEASQPELRWHLALMLPRLPLDLSERDRAIATLRQYLGDPSSIVKTMAIQGLFDLAQAHPASRSELSGLLEECCRAGTPAMRARSRKLLALLSAKSKSPRKSLSAGARRKKGL